MPPVHFLVFVFSKERNYASDYYIHISQNLVDRCYLNTFDDEIYRWYNISLTSELNKLRY